MDNNIYLELISAQTKALKVNKFIKYEKKK
jgi:hypothetical protein